MVELAASELPAYIAALPRLLTEHLYIQASGSLTANAINFEGFYGSGSIQIVQTDPDAVFKTQAILNYCNIHVIFNGIHFQPPTAGAIKNTYYGVRAVYCKSVEVHNCSFTGGSSIKNDYCAVNCNVGTNMHVYNIRADHCGTVALISNGAMLSLCAGDDSNALHDNTTGAYVYCGGVLTFFGNTPDLLGGAANAKQGGIIAKVDGTLL